jgi:hypothetical protein
MQETQHKTFEKPDEVRQFPNGHADILSIGESEVGRLVFERGWRWSNDVQPILERRAARRRISSTRERPARHPHGRRHWDDRRAGRCHLPAERSRRVGRRRRTRGRDRLVRREQLRQAKLRRRASTRRGKLICAPVSRTCLAHSRATMIHGSDRGLEGPKRSVDQGIRVASPART